jgi:hypothetical protein
MLARAFGNAAVLYSGRAGALARPTEKAEIEVIFESIVKLDAAVCGRFDEVNPATGRLRLQAQGAIGGTLI